MKRTSDQAERDSSGRHAYSLFCTIGALPGRTRLLALALKCEHDRSARNYAYQVLLIDEWRGPVQLLKSGTIDAAKGTITLPLYQGSLAGSTRRFGTS
jgi:hypothetical protein